VEPGKFHHYDLFSKYSTRALFSFVLEEEIVSSELDEKNQQKIMKEIENCPGKRFLKISELWSEFSNSEWPSNYRSRWALESNLTKPFSFFQPITGQDNHKKAPYISKPHKSLFHDIYTIIITPEFRIFGTFAPFYL